MISLKARMSLGLSASLVLLLGLQYLVVSGAIRETAEGYVASRLRHDTETLLTGLRWQGAEPAIASDAVGTIYRRPYSGHYFHVETAKKDLRSRSLWDGELPVPPVAVGESRRFHAGGPQDQPLLIRAAAFRKDGREVRISVAEDLSPLRADLRTFQWRYGLVSLAVAAALLGIQWVLVAAGMGPLRRMRREIGLLERGERTALSEDVPAEVRPLAGEVNRLVGVLGQRLERSRNALGNLAHALKTPLTRLFQTADHPGLAGDPELRARVLEPAERIRELIDRELGRARLAGGSPGQRFDPGREIPALVGTLEQIHAGRGITITSDIPQGKAYFGDREDMLELLGNLLDNACKWASGRVRITIAPGPGLDLAVEDDGPGIPEARRTALTGRGSRLDEAEEGHGLGLAIVRDIVKAYGGRLELGRSDELGGLRVRVVLPSKEE